MASVTYAIVFKGEILEGFQAFSVKAHLSKMMKADADKMATLFSGKQVVLKRTADKKEAARYGTALRKIGADVKVKVIKSAVKAAPAKPAATAAAGGQSDSPVDASGLTLAPNEGNLVEPKPAPPPPQMDLSEYSVAEMDGSPLVEHSDADIPVIDLDLSEYSVAENDGSPLVEPSGEEAPPLEAPDFGLDEPGAMLETLHEEKEEVHPDISALTLAEPGADILAPEERQREKMKPAEVDTSELSLESNFDT